MSNDIQQQLAADFEIIPPATVEQMHRKFASGIRERASNAVPQDASQREGLIEALEALLIEAARKNIPINSIELEVLAGHGKTSIERRTNELENGRHASAPFFGPYRSPTFTEEQEKEHAKAARKRKEAPSVRRVFGEQERLYMRLKRDAEISLTQKGIASYLQRHGYTITDYQKGYATDAAGKQQFKIGKLLKKEPGLYKAFSNDHTRASNNLLVVFSRNTEDIARMSTGRAWVSCMGAGGSYYKRVPLDIRQGTLIAYLTTEKDPDILNPLARILIKPYTKTKDNPGPSLSAIANKVFRRKEKLFAADTGYGIHDDSFREQVEKFVDKILNAGVYGWFELAKGLYADSIPSIKSALNGADIKTPDGTRSWWVEGLLHREDGPARIMHNGILEWYRHGRFHREDGPAVVSPFGDGGKEWYLNGQRHRENGPAVEKNNGNREWWLNGQLHREDGPAVECANGTREWYLNGQRHREDGPAAEYPNGNKAWYRNGVYHREDGPAIEYTDGNHEWYINGSQITEAGFNMFRREKLKNQAQKTTRSPRP